MGSRSYLKSIHNSFSLPNLIVQPRHSGLAMFTKTRTCRKPPILKPLSLTSTFSTTPSVPPMLIPISFVWLIMDSPWIWTQNDALSKNAFWTDSLACNLWRMRRYCHMTKGLVTTLCPDHPSSGRGTELYFPLGHSPQNLPWFSMLCSTP